MSDTAAPSPRRPRSVGVKLLWAALILLLLAVLLLGAGAGGLWWTVRSEAGTAWLLSRLPGLQVAAPKGALLTDFEAGEMTIALPAAAGKAAGSVVLRGVGWRGLRLGASQTAGPQRLWLRLSIDELHAARVDVLLPPDDKPAPLSLPASLRLPLEVDIKRLRVGELHAVALGEQPLRDLRAAVHLGAERGTLHRVDGLDLTWDRLRASGNARIGADAPFALDAQAALAQAVVAAPAASAASAAGALAWAASARVAGPLAQPTLTATLRARATPQQPEQALDARAVLRPFATWPLAELQASISALDLSALASAAPATALSGSARAQTSGLDQPAAVTLQLDNARAGRWNEGLLPLRRLGVELRGQPDDRRVLDLHAFDAELGTQRGAAGRVQGSGRWTPERVTLDLRLTDLQPAQLDARAAAMRLGGTVVLAVTGIDMTAPERASVELRADLAGPLAGVLNAVGAARPPRGVPRDARIELDATLALQRIELRRAVASLGAARATLAGTGNRASIAAPWRVDGKATLADFDPLPWWPGADDSPWRRGPHRLNANAEFDLTLPAVKAKTSTAAIDWLAALTGSARLKLAGSVLAGTPLNADATLRHPAVGAAQLTLAADLDGNRIDATGQLGGNAAADAIELTLAAPELARLTPLWRLLMLPAGSKAELTLAGALRGNASLRGRWPALSTRGQLDGSGLRLALPGRTASRLDARSLQARWQLGSAANAPVDLTLTLAGLSMPGTGAAAGPSIDNAQLTLTGTAAAHALSLNADSKALPPVWADALQAPVAGSAPSAAAKAAPPHTLAVLRAQGGLVSAAGGAWTASGWRGTLQQLELRSSRVSAAPWLRTRDLALAAQWAGGPASVTLQPGRVDLLGAALRFERIAWQAATVGKAAQIDGQATLEPIAVAPLLARLQPDFGWGGDLTISGTLSIRSAPTFAADIVLERARGDLTVTDEVGTQVLGLTDLRLGLNAANGVWSFTQGLAGKTLGVAAGAVVARTTPAATWPAADTPIEGVLELQVANLGTWGTWVPAGWRLGGALRTSATIGGRFGAPQYTGQIVGTGLSVRNFLQGVNVSDGDVAITLAGATARIERFSAKAGAGSVTLSGDASLGETPRAALTLRAERFQLLGRVDRRIVASGEARLVLQRRALALDGKFSVDEGLFDFTRSDAPALSDDVVVLRGGAVAPSATATAAAAAAPNGGLAAAATSVALNLQVDLGQRLRIRGRGLDSGLRGELKITSPNNRLAINGTVSTADGTYAAYGQKLAIDRGAITFAGSADNPRLDIEATRPNLDTRVGVRVAGTALNPRVRLFSEPELSDIDKLSWLVLGRASDGLGRTDTALLQRAAVALLAGEGEGVTGQITKAIGLDDVSLRQTDGEVRETVISLGKQLSRRWYVGYERGLNATTGTWQLVYRIAQRFTLRAQSGLDNSLDVIWTWRWQ